MSIDFEKATCQTETNKDKFGIYDPGDKKPAILKFEDATLWHATVINTKQKQIKFTAIDNCIDIFRTNGEMAQRCDGMLTFNTTIYYIELKTGRKAWQQEGLNQIESTIKQMQNKASAFAAQFTKRIAIVANKNARRPTFQSSNAAQREYFMKEYKTRVQFDAEINIQ